MALAAAEPLLVGLEADADALLAGAALLGLADAAAEDELAVAGLGELLPPQPISSSVTAASKPLMSFL